MPPRSVSHNLKAHIPVLHYEQGLNVKEICKLLGIKKSLVYKTLQYHHLYKLAYNPHAQHTGQTKMCSEEVLCLRSTVFNFASFDIGWDHHL